MTAHQTTEIAILGAGVVGLAIAEALVAEGREVVVVDPAPPGMGAVSYTHLDVYKRQGERIAEA